jgi:hypothetical protein
MTATASIGLAAGAHKYPFGGRRPKLNDSQFWQQFLENLREQAIRTREIRQFWLKT